MAADMPGQYTLIRARAFMPATPWCAAWRPSITSVRSDLGITAREPRTMASPTQESSSLTSQYGRRLSGRLCLCGGNPSRMCCARACIVGSWHDADCTRSHVTARCGKSSVSINAAATDVSTAASRVLGSWEGWSWGCLDMALAALLSFPGTYFILNLYIRVFSLSRRSLGFGMSCRSLSPSSFTRGSWSTASVRCGFPRMNIQHFSNA